MRVHSKLCALLLAVFVAGCASEDREVEYVSPLTTYQQAMQVNVAWKASSSGRGSSGHYLRLQHDVVDGTVYTASYNGNVIAANAQDGRTRWQTNVNEPITSGVAAQGNLVVVGTIKGSVIALDAVNGAERWRRQAPSEIIAMPSIAGDKVLIKTESGDVQAFDRNTGKNAWSYHLKPPELMLRGASAPVVVGNRVLAGFSDGQLVSLNLNDGHLQWTRQIATPHGASAVDRLVDIDSDPVVRDGVVYVVSYHGKVAAINLDTGNQLWAQDMSSHAGLTVGVNNVYVVDDHSRLWALDRQTGRVVWQQDKLEGRGLAQPVLQRGALVVGDSHGYLHWVSSKTGQFLARHSVDSKRLLATPQLYKGNLIVLSTGGTLQSLNALPIED